MGHVLALSGGVGGAKLAYGLAQILPPEDLTIVVNTGDDFDHLGLRICPDFDTVLYTLAKVNNRDQGWGRADETWSVFETLKALGGESWFQLGDKDVALHLMRRALLDNGMTLSEVAEHLCRRLMVHHRIVPMSDAPVRTIIETADGGLEFQRYFVEQHCEPQVTGFRFEGAEDAELSPGFAQILDRQDLAGVIVCPSNPFVSVGPILAVSNVRMRLAELRVPVIAVSPIVGGQALKGPTAKMMSELQLPRSATAVAQLYRDFLSGYVLDVQDAAESRSVAGLGLDVLSAQTVMTTDHDKVVLAETCLNFVRNT